MKWLIYYKQIYFLAYLKVDIIGYSDKNENELFDILEKEYPNVPVLKIDNPKEPQYSYDYYNKNGEKVITPNKDFITFQLNDLKEF